MIIRLHAVAGFFDGNIFDWLGVLIPILVLALAWIKRRAIWERILYWKNLRQRSENAEYHLMNALSFLRHIQEAMAALRRQASGDSRDQVQVVIREQLLEPVRGLLPTSPGENLRVTWFCPDPDDADRLSIRAQVGHAKDDEGKLHLGAGEGLVGRCFTLQEVVQLDHASESPHFKKFHVSNYDDVGSIICVPVMCDGHATGVLCLSSDLVARFWIADVEYVQALAAAIGAFEALDVTADAAKSSELESTEPSSPDEG